MTESKTEKPISKAKEMKYLFKKYDNLRQKYETSNFKEPIAQLIRRNGKVGFFENATKGEFTFEHSDGSQRNIYLDPKWLKTFPYGNKEFRGYILDEDSPTPLPANPVTTAEQVNIVIEKSMADLNAMKAKEIMAKGKLIQQIAIGVAILAGCFILYKVLVPSGGQGVVEPVATAAVQQVQNASQGLSGQTISIIT